ncbi:MAG TPA: type IV toxin-antitoxin system AbiEi family antitoxin domain-containing protein [Capillimicrobium sp.]|nr:type IV toxin-antitoxin system AbiEi family antitoxin domain-containing protein [Capillimicrobium sp.]
MARRAGRQHGVVDLDELRACGLTRNAVSNRVRAGWLHPKHRGVYAVGHPELTLRGEFMAAVKACGPGAVLSHVSAAVLHALVDWDDRFPEVTVHGSATRLHRGIRVHRTSDLPAGDRTYRDRIPVTTPVRTLLDLAAVLDSRRLRRAVNQALALRLTTIPDLVHAIEAKPGRRGAARLRAILASAAPTRSILEDVVLGLVLRGGLEPPDVNVPLRLDGRVVIPDLRWPAQRLVVEADSRRWHDNPLARAHDAERQRVLERHGERVVRITWRQAVARPAETLARLRAAGAPAAR